MRGFKRRLKPLHRASVLAQCLPPHAVMFPSAASLCSAITAGTSTEGDVQSMTFDVVSSPATSLLPARQRRAAADQQRDRAAIQHIYSSPCNYQTGSTYYGTVDVTSESNRLSLMLYHVAAKVDLMWNVDKTVQADNRLTYIQARRLKQQGCKPRHWNASSRPAVSPGTRGSRGAMPWTTCRKPSTACTKRCCPQASRRAPSMWQREITYYGRRHGRSGGIYVRNCGSIYNSVFWGNIEKTKWPWNRVYRGVPGFYWSKDTSFPDLIQLANVVVENGAANSDVAAVLATDASGASTRLTELAAQKGPGFKDAAAGDWTLKRSSVMIDAGVKADWMNSASDLAGHKRCLKRGLVSDDALPDIGCYEFHAIAGFKISLR